MTPDLLDLHSLLNPLGKSGAIKFVKDSTNFELEQEVGEIVLKSKHSEEGPKIKKVGEEHDDVSKNVSSCEVCGKTFKKLRRLEDHRETHLKKAGDVKPCKECGKDVRTSNLDCKRHDIASQHKQIKSKNFCCRLSF